MSATETTETQEDLDQIMRVVARNVAMGIHELGQILAFCNVDPRDFTRWQSNPRFLKYLKAEQEAWENANNVGERTKLKSGIIIEEWLPEAYVELKDRKIPLNQRVELGKLIAKIAGMGEPKGIGVGVNDGGGGFTLQINIGLNAHVKYDNNDSLKVIDHDIEAEAPQRLNPPRRRADYELVNDELGIPENE